jgi:hypothetical protein
MRIVFVLFLFSITNLTLAQVSDSDKDYELRKNSVYAQNFIIFPSLYYDRMIPLSKHFGISPKVGIGLISSIETTFYYGFNRHFGEIGAGYLISNGVDIILNYRYMGKKGLLFKAGFNYIPGEEAAPLLAIGYSF